MSYELPERIHRMEPFWGLWHIDRFLGKGQYGRVYRLIREELNVVYSAALKWIPLPEAEQAVRRAAADGVGQSSYLELALSLQKEILLLRKLRAGNIVSYEDHMFHKRADCDGWDVFIRMELLTSLDQYLADHCLSPEAVIRLGVDICKALEECRRLNIIHRDIKPENIFVSIQDSGEAVYKLGDFGIARQIENTRVNRTFAGTISFMAPEIRRMRPEGYDGRVDIYSLGLVLYVLLNGYRLPFLPLSPEKVSMADREAAIARRMQGEPLPRPCSADEALWEIIEKACAYQPEDRYDTVTAMRRALESIHPAAHYLTKLEGAPSCLGGELTLSLAEPPEPGGPSALKSRPSHRKERPPKQGAYPDIQRSSAFAAQPRITVLAATMQKGIRPEPWKAFARQQTKPRKNASVKRTRPNHTAAKAIVLVLVLGLCAGIAFHYHMAARSVPTGIIMESRYGNLIPQPQMPGPIAFSRRAIGQSSKAQETQRE